MYIPKFNEENNLETLHALINAKPFGTWATLVNGAIEVNHIPFVLNKNIGEFGTLYCHIAKANPLWQQFSTTQNSVISFHGDQSYISPSWYPSKQIDGKVVPTWNYSVVQAQGIPKIMQDPQQLLAHLNELTDIHESSQYKPWQVSDAPAAFIEKLCAAIVGFEIPITRISGKWKLGQNRPEADKLGMIAGLTSGNNQERHGLATELQKQLQE